MPYSDSDTVTTSTSLYPGVWLHDPLDPEGTLVRFAYGKNGRSSSIDTLGEGNLYAGREYPVVDFGEHTSEKVSVTIEIPDGTDAAASLAALDEFARSKRTLFYRDNRGRAFYATLSGYTRSDASWGTGVSFEAARVHYSVTEVV